MPIKPVLLSLMAHPDDAEILCGGTLALLAKRGWDIHIASVTPGDCGSPNLPPEEIAAIRRKEGSSAAAVIGASYHCLERRDLRIFYDDDGVRRATTLFRRLQPDLVITHAPKDYMLDHEETSKLARAACFNTPIPNAPLTEKSLLSPSEHIPHLYYADPIEGVDPLGQPVKPGIVVDVSDVIDDKLEMLSKHESQREWLRAHHGMDEYIEATRRWSAQRGGSVGRAYGEGFRQHLGHAYPQTDLLKETLGKLVITR